MRVGRAMKIKGNMGLIIVQVNLPKINRPYESLARLPTAADISPTVDVI